MKKEKGFTLLEMIIAIAVIAVIVSGMVYYGKGMIEDGKVMNAVSYIVEFRNAMKRYYANHGSYPTKISQLTEYIDMEHLPEGVYIGGYNPNYPNDPCKNSPVLGLGVKNKDIREKFINELNNRGWFCGTSPTKPDRVRIKLAP